MLKYNHIVVDGVIYELSKNYVINGDYIVFKNDSFPEYNKLKNILYKRKSVQVVYGEFKAEYNAGPTNVIAIATGSDMQGGLLYGYYKSDHFISEGVDKGRGAFLVWSTSNVSWLSANTAGLYVTNITGTGRMWWKNII